MARINNRGVVQALERNIEASIHRFSIGTRQVDSPARVDKKRVPGDQISADKEALRSRRMPWGVEEFHLDLADLGGIARFDLDDVGVRQTRDLLGSRGFM